MAEEPAEGPAEERFLVLAPTGRDAALTSALLAKAGLRGEACADIQELCRRFEAEGAGALLLAEEVLVPTAVARLRELLARQGSWSDVPIIVFTGTPASASGRAPSGHQLASLGNVTLLERPLRPLTVVSAARAALRARRRQYVARAELFEQQRAVRLRDQFLAMLGHELRNPLSAISMAVNLDQERARTKYGEILRRQVGHLTRLVDDLLDVARVTSGKIALRLEPIDLGALVQRLTSTLRPLAHAGTTLRCEIPSEPLLLAADAVRLEQIITNLITNAIKYTAAGGVIEVKAQRDGGEARLEVRDSGVGLAPDMLHRIFDLFTQVEETLDRSKGGMGIGLTLVRSLVELHGGSVSAESAGLGRGSVFVVKLPLRAAPSAREDELDGRRFEERRASSAQPALRHDVLIVEDNADSRELLALLIAELGHHVHTAVDGPSGVREAVAHRPHVLLVDIGLPGLDGYAVARKLREELGRHVYLVALTGYGQPEDRKRALQAGFDVHLTKPVDPEHLASLLRSPELDARRRTTQRNGSNGSAR